MTDSGVNKLGWRQRANREQKREQTSETLKRLVGSMDFSPSLITLFKYMSLYLWLCNKKWEIDKYGKVGGNETGRNDVESGYDWQARGGGGGQSKAMRQVRFALVFALFTPKRDVTRARHGMHAWHDT